jgi:RNA polymerase sigma factor (TIGR02999 family)
MTTGSTIEVSQLLLAWSDGDRTTLEALTPLVYADLHRLAGRYMRDERPGHPLQTTALVNEAYLRLIDLKQVCWQNRAQFFAIAAQLMRHILVDFARGRLQTKRGGGTQQVSLAEAVEVSKEHAQDCRLRRCPEESG